MSPTSPDSPSSTSPEQANSSPDTPPDSDGKSLNYAHLPQSYIFESNVADSATYTSSCATTRDDDTDTIDDANTSMMDYDEGIDDAKSYDIGYHQLQQRELLGLEQQQEQEDDDDDQASFVVDAKLRRGTTRSTNDFDEEDHSTASNDDVSSGFGSGGYDTLSYGSIGAGGVDINTLMMDPNAALMLEDVDFGDNDDNDEDLDTPVERLVRRSECLNSHGSWDNGSAIVPRCVRKLYNECYF